jgi:hypothetical protein
MRPLFLRRRRKTRSISLLLIPIRARPHRFRDVNADGSVVVGAAWVYTRSGMSGANRGRWSAPAQLESPSKATPSARCSISPATIAFVERRGDGAQRWRRRGALFGVAVQRKNQLTPTISRKHPSGSDGKVSSLLAHRARSRPFPRPPREVGTNFIPRNVPANVDRAGQRRGAMNDARRYRVNAAECLSAAETCGPLYRGLTLDMVTSWLALARQAEAEDELVASWGKANAAAFTALPSLTPPPPVSIPSARGRVVAARFGRDFLHGQRLI